MTRSLHQDIYDLLLMQTEYLSLKLILLIKQPTKRDMQPIGRLDCSYWPAHFSPCFPVQLTTSVRFNLAVIMLTLLILLFVENTDSLLMSPSSCSHPLGMESGSILDSQLSASSSYASSVGPEMGRLHGEKGGGAWCPSGLVGGQQKDEEWLEVDLERTVLLTSVSIQGRWAHGHGLEFSPGVRIVTDDSVTEILTASRDTYTVVNITLDAPKVTKKIRLIPYSKHLRTVCIRAEFYGCDKVEDDADIFTIIPVIIGVMLTFIIIFIILITIIYLNVRRRKCLNSTSDKKSLPYFHQNLLLDISEPIYDEPLPKREPNFSLSVKTFENDFMYSVPFVSGFSSADSLPSSSTFSSSSESLKFSSTSKLSPASSVRTSKDNLVTFSPIYNVFAD